MAAVQPVEAVVAGHICLDITPLVRPGTYRAMGDLIRPGTLVDVGPAAVGTGGAVSNTGLALGKLGVRVALMGKCGRDPFGRVILDLLKAQAPGAERGMRMVDGEHTSYTVVLAVPGLDRAFIHCPGANNTFAHDDIDFGLVGRGRLFHFGYPTLMKGMFQNGGRELIRVFQSARETGVITSLDFSLPDPQSEAGSVDWPAVLARTLPCVDLFMPSAEELLFLLDKPLFLDLCAKVPPHGTLLDVLGTAHLRALAEQCLKLGVRVCVIKCGKHGVYIRTAGKAALAAIRGGNETFLEKGWAGRELFKPSFRVDKIATATGAGDNAIAGFLAAFLNRSSIFESLDVMAIVGAQNLTVMDAVSGVKSWTETRAQLAANPPLNPVTLDLGGWASLDGKCYAGPADSEIKR